MEFITTGTVARQLGLSRERVLQLLAQAGITAERDSTGRRLLSPQDIERLLRQREASGARQRRPEL